MSKKTFYQKYYADQPRWAKGVINVVAVGGVAFAGYSIYRGIQKRRAIEKANTAANQATGELQVLAQRGIYPSYYTSQYELMSNQLVQAMNGCGTDEEMILQVIRSLKNDADVLMLIRSFGVRFYQPCSWAQPISYALYLIDSESFGGGIGEWFGYDLSAGDIEDINDILQSKGIQYRF